MCFAAKYFLVTWGCATILFSRKDFRCTCALLFVYLAATYFFVVVQIIYHWYFYIFFQRFNWSFGYLVCRSHFFLLFLGAVNFNFNFLPFSSISSALACNSFRLDTRRESSAYVNAPVFDRGHLCNLSIMFLHCLVNVRLLDLCFIIFAYHVYRLIFPIFLSGILNFRRALFSLQRSFHRDVSHWLPL